MPLQYIPSTFFVVLLLYWAYMKKPRFPLLVIVGLGTIATISFWRTGVFESGDFSVHTQFLMQFYGALKEGVLIPQWGAQFCNNYGYPLFTYFYKLPYYIGSLFHLFGLNFIDSTKLLFCLGYTAAGLSMYTLLRHKFAPTAALLGTVLYMFAPYQLTGLHFRHALGELFGYIFLPLFFLYIDKLIAQSTRKNWVICVMLFSALILSHHIAPLFTLLILTPYMLWQRKILLFLSVIFSALALTIFHWMPLILENSFIHQNIAPVYFVPTSWYFYAPWRFGLLFQGSHGELGTLLGYAHLIIIIFSLPLAFNKKIKTNDQRSIKIFLGITFFAFLMMQKFTAPLWEHISFLHNLQFSSRLLFVTTFTIPLLAGHVVTYRSYISSHITRPVIYLFMFFSIVYTQLNWSNRGMIPNIDDTILRNQIPERCDSLLIPSTIDVAKFTSLIKKRDGDTEVLSGSVKIIAQQKFSHRHMLTLVADTQSLLQINTTNFPGWHVTDNGQPTRLNPHKPFIEIPLEKGFHRIAIEYRAASVSMFSYFLKFL